MKKSSLILGAAALMLATACSNDEVVNVAPQTGAIGFSSFVNNSTRATDLDANNLTSLQVYGVTYNGSSKTTIFNGVELAGEVKENNTTAWSYVDQNEGPRYWITDFNYTFAAVAPANAGVTVNNEVPEVKNGGISSIDIVNTGNVDLLFDAVEVPTTESLWGEMVHFNLRHIMSRFIFKFTNNVKDENYKIKVSDVKITNAYEKGSYNPGENAWTIAENAENNKTYEFAVKKAEALKNEKATTESMFFIPVIQGENDGFKVEFNVTLSLKDAQTGTYKEMKVYPMSATLDAKNYQLGWSYSFNTVLTWENVIGGSDNEIKFTVDSVNTWDSETDEDGNEKEASFTSSEKK